MINQQRGSAGLIKLAVIFAVCGILAIAGLLLPKGFKDDLSLIGQGNVSAVLLHDKNLVSTTKMMELMNKVRSDYEPGIVFLAADIVTPAGRNFSQTQGIGVVNLLIFDPDGKRLTALNGGANEQQLREVLDGVAR